MANLKNINLMSQDTFESIEQVDDELYAVSGSGIGFPSSRYEDLTLGASGTKYTAPANGWFYLNKATGGTNQYIVIDNNTKGYGFMLPCYNSGVNLRDKLQVQKGDIVSVWYSASGTTNTFRFIYAEGE